MLTQQTAPEADVAGAGSRSINRADWGVSVQTIAQTTPSPLASLFDPVNGQSVTSTLRLRSSEDLAEWVDICFFLWVGICFFLSLQARHQHALVLLVHQPSFAQD